MQENKKQGDKGGTSMRSDFKVTMNEYLRSEERRVGKECRL